MLLVSEGRHWCGTATEARPSLLKPERPRLKDRADVFIYTTLIWRPTEFLILWTCESNFICIAPFTIKYLENLINLIDFCQMTEIPSSSIKNGLLSVDLNHKHHIWRLILSVRLQQVVAERPDKNSYSTQADFAAVMQGCSLCGGGGAGGRF